MCVCGRGVCMCERGRDMSGNEVEERETGCNLE